MISPKIHGILDYVTVIIFAIAPALFNLSETGAVIAYILAAVHLFMTVLTDFPPGLIKVIPFKFHGYIELLVGIVLAIVPWVVNFISETGQLFFSIIGVVILLVFSLTNYKSLLKK